MNGAILYIEAIYESYKEKENLRNRGAKGGNLLFT